MRARIKSYYNFIFFQDRLPKWIVRLNYVSLAGIIPWPLVAFASIFIFDNPQDMNTAYLEFFLLTGYPIILLIITFFSFKLFPFSKGIAAALPIIPILLYIFVIGYMVSASTLIPFGH